MAVKGSVRQGNYPKAKYHYPKGSKNPYTWRTCPVCGERALVRVYGKGFCSKRCAQSGKNNTMWRGDTAGYEAFHNRVYRSRGKASEQTCRCGKQARDWANLTGQYSDVNDYDAMCRSCHIEFDNQRRKGGE